MTKTIISPITLLKGEINLYLEQFKCSQLQSWLQVIFVTYDSCPAMVIVKGENGRRWRCPRDHLFIYEEEKTEKAVGWDGKETL